MQFACKKGGIFRVVRQQKNSPLGKINLSAIVIDFVAIFTVFTEEVSGIIRSKFCFCYNIFFQLKYVYLSLKVHFSE